jgi:hypothetical protein
MQTHADQDRSFLISVGSFINLCASGHADAIVNGLPFRIAIPACVLSPLSTEIDQLLLDDAEIARPTLLDMVETGAIDTAAPVSDREWQRFSVLSAQWPKTQKPSTHVICALAPERNWGVISDSPNIHDFNLKCVPQFPILTTAMVINIWCERRHIPLNIIGEIFEQAQARIRYRPSRQDPMFAWWLECMETQR